jgi:NitT/TauT family transport system substrate-binding protein
MNVRRAILLLTATVVLAGPFPALGADKLVVAVNKLSAGSPLYIGRAKGFFAEENLDVSLLHSTSAQTIGLAVASGDAPIGMTALTAGIYTIAGKGGMKIVAGGYEEMPGFKGLALLYNNAVYDRGKRTPADLAGMKVGTTQTGSPQENQLARLAKKYKFDYGSMSVVALQTLPNLVSAIRGGQIDATNLPATLALGVERSGAAKIIAWMADEVPGQIGGIFANPATMAQHPDMVTRFLRAYIKSIRYYDRAFQQKGPDGKPIKGDNYDETLKIIADYLEEPAAQVEAGLPYFNPDARLATSDLADQIEAWKSIKQLEPSISLDKVLEPKFLAQAKADK